MRLLRFADLNRRAASSPTGPPLKRVDRSTLLRPVSCHAPRPGAWSMRRSDAWFEGRPIGNRCEAPAQGPRPKAVEAKAARLAAERAEA